MFRLLKRYFLTALIIFCLFWLFIDLMWVQWKKDDQYADPPHPQNSPRDMIEDIGKLPFVDSNTDQLIPQRIKHNIFKTKEKNLNNHFKNLNRFNVKPHQQKELPKIVDKIEPLQPREELVDISYFKKFYKYSLHPQPGSPGMNGEAVVNPPLEKVREDIGFKNYSFNELSSSKISLERSVPDNRVDA